MGICGEFGEKLNCVANFDVYDDESMEKFSE